MNVLVKKVLRDIRYSKGRSLSIVFILMIAVALYGGLFLAYVNITRSFEDQSNATHIESVRFQTNYIDPSSLDFTNISGIEAWDSRIAMTTNLKIAGENDTYTLSLFGISNTTRPKVNDFLIMKGSFFTGNRQILLTNSFMTNHNLNIGDRITVLTANGEVDYTIQAAVFSMEYIYNVNPKTGLPDVSGLAAGWVSSNEVQQDFNLLANTVNEILVRFDSTIYDNTKLFDERISQVQDEILKQSSRVNFIKEEQEAEKKMRNGDVGALDDMARAFGLIIAILAFFAIWDSISKLISSQRNVIGTMQALGGSKWKIVGHYTLLAALLTFLGVALGIPLGWGIAEEMTVEYGDILGMPAPTIYFMWSPFFEAIAVNGGFAIFFGFIASLGTAKINPRDAMSSVYIAMSYKSRSIVERFLSKLLRIRKPTNVIPLRSLFGSKKRTTFTVITYAMSMVILIAALGFSNSFDAALDQTFTHDQQYDLQVYFYGAYNLTQFQSELGSISQITDFEGFVASPIEVSSGSQKKTVQMYGFEPDSKLRKFTILDEEQTFGIAISSLLANDFDLGVGDSLTVSKSTYKVNSISQELVDDGIFMSLSDAQDIMQIGTNVTGILVKLNDPAVANTVNTKLQNSNLPIALIINKQAMRDSIESMIQGLMALIAILVIIGFMTIALFSFNTILLSVISREMEFVNLRTLGSSKRKIFKLVIVESLFTIIFGSILAVPIGYVATKYILDATTQGLMTMQTVVKPMSYVNAIVFAFVASLIGVIAGYRHVQKIDLVDFTRKKLNV